MSTTNPSDYELIDFGNGRKLERFGSVVTDRPCPASSGLRKAETDWESAQLIYDPDGKKNWIVSAASPSQSHPSDWICKFDGFRFRLKTASAGQVGIFPEHWAQWSWITDRLANWTQSIGDSQSTPNALNMFAYTGATSLKLAKLGAKVTHVDAMQSAVQWGRDNAELSNMHDAPIRWIVEDARRYAERERKRGNRYELILLDPPTYGHGTNGKDWQIHRDLLPLLEVCADLLSDAPIGIILTGHSRDIRLRDCIEVFDAVGKWDSGCSSELSQAKLVSRHRKELDCGYVAKFCFSRLTEC